MTRTPTARIATAAAIGFAPAVVWVVAAAPPGGGERFLSFVAAVLVLGTPLAIAAAIMSRRFATVDGNGDLGERVLGFATAGLRDSRADWGAAMRAELASIDDPRERRRFAVGCIGAAIRADMGRRLWLSAIGAGTLFAAGTYAASRLSLASGRGGIMSVTLLMPIVVLFVLSLVTARSTWSFRTGLVTGWLALLVGLVGMLAVAVLEAGSWYDVAGVYVMDGDSPKESIDRLTALLDPIAPSFILFHLYFWVSWPVIGAAVGSWSALRRKDATPTRAALSD